MSGKSLSEMKSWAEAPNLTSELPREESRTRLRLRMTQTIDGSLNGRDVTTYQAGSTYELPDQGPGGLADVFLREGWAEEVQPADALQVVYDEFFGGDANHPELLEARAELASETLTPHRCQAVTSRKAQCERDAADGSDYCSIPAHQKQGQN